jgi:hypothetical protein
MVLPPWDSKAFVWSRKSLWSRAQARASFDDAVLCVAHDRQCQARGLPPLKLRIALNARISGSSSSSSVEFPTGRYLTPLPVAISHKNILPFAIRSAWPDEIGLTPNFTATKNGSQTQCGGNSPPPARGSGDRLIKRDRLIWRQKPPFSTHDQSVTPTPTLKDFIVVGWLALFYSISELRVSPVNMDDVPLFTVSVGATIDRDEPKLLAPQTRVGYWAHRL